MKLLFKQRFFSWLDSYDIYDEAGCTVFTVEGRLSFGHCLDILDVRGETIGRVKEEVFTLLPRFALYAHGEYMGQLRKELTFFKPTFDLECSGWQVTGDFWEWEYEIAALDGRAVAYISKELWNFTDTYVLDVADPADALAVLMVALAIDAVKCSQS